MLWFDVILENIGRLGPFWGRWGQRRPRGQKVRIEKRSKNIGETLKKHWEALKSIEKSHNCFTQLYNLCRNKKAPKDYILNILEEAVKCLHFGIKLAERAEPHNLFIDKMKYFEKEGRVLSKIGLQIAKMCYGNDSLITAIWTARGSKYFELYWYVSTI